MQNNISYISLGSNIGDSETIVKETLTMLSNLPKTTLTGKSSLYQSEPVSNIKQDPFINAVVRIQTELQPHELLLELQALEEAFYRQRTDGERWGPRTLDLDIILFGNLKLDDSHLTIPHREFQNRLFVLVPMQEISGDLFISGYGSLSFLMKNAPQYALEKLDD